MLKPTDRYYSAALVTGLIFLSMMLGSNIYAADSNPCSNDIAVFCKDIKPGTTAMMYCLEAHESQLSAACKDYEAKIRGARVERSEDVRHRAEVRRACRDDVTKFCQDVNPVKSGYISCLREHEGSISAACRDSIKIMDQDQKKK